MLIVLYVFFFFNDTATTEIYTLSLHDALPICLGSSNGECLFSFNASVMFISSQPQSFSKGLRDSKLRSEEHTSELQSRQYLVCRLLLEKKKTRKRQMTHLMATSRRHCSMSWFS